MKLLLLTCDVTRKIIPTQQWLFKKYVNYPFEYIYIDLKSEDITDEMVELHKINLKIKRKLGLTRKLKPT